MSEKTMVEYQAMADKFIGASTAARMLMCDVSRAYRLVQRGDIQSIVIDGHPYILRTSLEQWIAGAERRARLTEIEDGLKDIQRRVARKR